ncbi:MAG: DUF4190 domain-containing protein [Armatimonadetes bacterium]|nr:DUF4190 domain-containing protein [Armatimonadota bacterium]
MNEIRYQVDGMGEKFNAISLAEKYHSGQLYGHQVVDATTGETMSPDQVKVIVDSVYIPPPVANRTAQAQADGNKDPMRFVAPVHASAKAVAAGYLGLFAVIPCAAPFALAVGLWALNDIKKNPHKTGKGRAIFAVIMGAIFTVALVVILASMAQR